MSESTAGEGADAPALAWEGRGVVTGRADVAEATPAALAAAAAAAAASAAATAACRLALAADAANAKGDAGRGFALPVLARGVNNFPTPVSYGLGTLGVTRGFAGGSDSCVGDSAGPAGVGAAGGNEGVGVPGNSGRRFRRKLMSISAAVTPCFGGSRRAGVASARWYKNERVIYNRRMSRVRPGLC